MLTHTTTFAALVAALFMLQGQPAQAAPQAQGMPAAKAQVIELPRVVITGKRLQPMPIVQLPRVEIVARRLDSATRLVQAKAAAKPV